MRVKVICEAMVYNGEIYHNGDYVEVEDKKEREIMVQERCVVESPELFEEKKRDKTVRIRGGRK